MIDFGDTRESLALAGLLRNHFKGLVAVPTSEEFQKSLFAGPEIIPNRPFKHVALKQALGTLTRSEISTLFQRSVEFFSSAPVEHVRVVVWLRYLIESTAYHMTGERDYLNEFHKEIMERMGVYQDCMRLHGRTKLLVTQLNNRNVSGATAHMSEEEEEEEDSSDKEEDQWKEGEEDNGNQEEVKDKESNEDIDSDDNSDSQGDSDIESMDEESEDGF